MGLTEEELRIDCGISHVLANLFFGLLFGVMALVPVTLVYAGLQTAIPSLPTAGSASGLTMGLCVGVALVWAFVAAEHFREVSFRFNSSYLKVYRDNIVRTQILWEDVESVRQGMPYRIRTRQGTVVEIPFGALMSEKHEHRSLKNQLEGFQKPTTELSPAKFGWIGLVSLVIGLPLFLLAKKPVDVFGNPQGVSGMGWIQAIPSILGAAGTVIGLICLVTWLSLVADRKKNHPFRVATEGIWEGQNLIPWGDVERITRLGPKNKQLQLLNRNGSRLLIDCDKYLDGDDLREAILFMAPPGAMPAPSMGLGLLPGQTLIAKSWKTQADVLGCLGMVAVLAAGSSLLLLTGSMGVPQGSETTVIAAVGIPLSLLLTSAMISVSYTLELSDTEIRFKRMLFPQEVISLDSIERVEVRCIRGKEAPLEIVTISAKSVLFTFNSKLEKYGEIRDAIYARVPADRIRSS